MKKFMLMSVLGFSLVTSAQAFDGLDMAGFYGGANIGNASMDCVENTSEECSETAWKGFAGYKVSDMISVEGGYYDFGESEYSINAVQDGVTSTTGWGVAGVMTQPVADQVDLFGKAGFMKWTSETDIKAGALTTSSKESSGTDLLLGAGANYQMNENLGIRGEYEYVGGDAKVGMYSVGATFSTF